MGNSDFDSVLLTLRFDGKSQVDVFVFCVGLRKMPSHVGFCLNCNDVELGRLSLKTKNAKIWS